MWQSQEKTSSHTRMHAHALLLWSCQVGLTFIGRCITFAPQWVGMYLHFFRYFLLPFLSQYKCTPWNTHISSQKPLRLLLQNNGNDSMTTPPISFQNKSFVKIRNGAVVSKTGCIYKSVIIIYFPFMLLPLLIAWDVLSAFGSECLFVVRSQSGSCVAAVPAEEADLLPPTERK